MKIVENAKPLCSIVLPASPTPREVFAAQELVDYVKKISGVTLPLSDQYENKILIGEPKRNAHSAAVMTQATFEALVPGPEGFIIDIAEDTLLLAGSSNHPMEQERGTLYAVYAFLEQFLGCSLAAYSKKGLAAGEFVPQLSEITLRPDRYVKKCADVEYRTAIVQYGSWVGDPNHPLNEQFISWLAKNRYNRILTWSGVYEGYKKNGMLREAEKRGILFSVGHHQAITMLLPPEGNDYFPEPYAKTHPEYYRLLEDGTRYQVKAGDFRGQMVLCLRNHDLICQMAENIINWSNANPQVDVIVLWPQDGKHEQCCCEECQKHSKSANYSYFVSQVAKLVYEKKPNIHIDLISYLDIMECEMQDLPSNVIVDKAVWHETLRGVGKPDGSCLADSEFEHSILSWKRAGATVVYYDYFMGIYSCKQKWMPMADELQAVCKRFLEVGIHGLGTQLEAFHMWNHLFNFYTYGRTAYDTTISMEQALERFSLIFGKGAPYVKEVIRIGEALLDGQTIPEAALYLMENIDKENVYALYEQALVAAEDAFSRNNIRLMRMVFRYSDLQAARETAVDAGSTIPEPHLAELFYMRQNFDSFVSGKEGFGIAIPFEDPCDAKFVPNKWYAFE